MLAGAEAVDAMIDAAAGVHRSIEVADLDLIGRSALRTHTKRAEDRMLGLQCLDRSDLRASAPAPKLDLVLVAGIPALRRRRSFEDRPGTPAAPPGRWVAGSG